MSEQALSERISQHVATAIDETIDTCIDLVAGSYPENVFRPLPDEAKEILYAAMRATTVTHPTERLYAEWARERANTIRHARDRSAINRARATTHPAVTPEQQEGPNERG